MAALKGHQENAISRKQMDSVQEKTPAVSATEIIVDSQQQSSFPAPSSQTPNDGRRP